MCNACMYLNSIVSTYQMNIGYSVIYSVAIYLQKGLVLPPGVGVGLKFKYFSNIEASMC